jgi:hypothetical protein
MHRLRHTRTVRTKTYSFVGRFGSFATATKAGYASGVRLSSWISSEVCGSTSCLKAHMVIGELVNRLTNLPRAEIVWQANAETDDNNIEDPQDLVVDDEDVS